MEYVTDEAKTGEDIWINLLNNIFAIAVPKKDNSNTYNNESYNR